MNRDSREEWISCGNLDDDHGTFELACLRRLEGQTHIQVLDPALLDPPDSLIRSSREEVTGSIPK